MSVDGIMAVSCYRYPIENLTPFSKPRDCDGYCYMVCVVEPGDVARFWTVMVFRFHDGKVSSVSTPMEVDESSSSPRHGGFMPSLYPSHGAIRAAAIGAVSDT